jgi:hypothetical protein
MLRFATIALGFAILFVAQVKLLPQPSEAEACSYNCVVGP